MPIYIIVAVVIGAGILIVEQVIAIRKGR